MQVALVHAVKVLPYKVGPHINELITPLNGGVSFNHGFAFTSLTLHSKFYILHFHVVNMQKRISTGF